MPILIWIMSNKRWTVIVILLTFSFWKTWQTNHYAGELNKADAVCDTRVKTEVDKAIKPYIEAQKQAEANAQKASEDYEKSKESERVKTETITRTVQKIIDRPVYINTCFDSDGVSAVNAAGNTS